MSNSRTSRSRSPGVLADARASTAAAGTASGTTIARSRSTSGKRPTAGARSGREAPRGEAVERDLGDDDPAGRPQLPGLDDVRVQLADDRVQAAADLGPGGPAGVEHGLRRSRPRRRDGRGRGGARASSRTPLASSRSYGRAARFHAAGLGGADEREARDATTRAARRRSGRSPCRSRTRRRPRCRGAGSRRPRRAGCRAGCGGAASGRARAGSSTPIGVAARLVLVADRRDLAREHERLDVPRRDERRRDDLGEPGAGERLADELADLERRRRGTRGIAVSGVTDGHAARSRGRGRSPRRRPPRSAMSRRQVGTSAVQRGRLDPATTTQRLGLERDRDGLVRPRRARSRRRPARAASRCSAAGELGAEQPVDAGRAGTRRVRGSGSSGAVSTTPARDLAAGPRAGRAAPCDRRRGGPAAAPGPSRSGWTPPSAARGAGRSGGC